MGVHISYIKKDATILSSNSDKNQGIDEVLQLGSSDLRTGERAINRILIAPDVDDILAKIQNKNATDFKVVLDLKCTRALQIPTEFTVYANAISTRDNLDWINGLGTLSDVPEVNDGVSWKSITGLTTQDWIYESGSAQPEYPTGATGSYEDTIGGGTWHTGSKYEYTASITENPRTIDLSIDITEYIKEVSSGSIEDRGLIIRVSPDIENSSLDYTLNYFSKDTNTIFYPTAKLYYNDYEYTGSVVPVITDSDAVVKISNLKNRYDNLLSKRLDLHVRPKHPVRTFTTSSIYLSNYKLPEDSLWSLEDYYTGEVIIPFDSEYTKINSDDKGSYILVDTLVPYRRFYNFVIRTTIDDNEVIVRSTAFKIDRDV